MERLTETPLQWVECGSGLNGRDPPHELSVWCPDRRRFRCPCTRGMPAELLMSVVFANDLLAICGLGFRFCAILCLPNYYTPASLLANLRDWVHARTQRHRLEQAISIIGFLSPDDGPGLDVLLRAHGKFGPLPPFSQWTSSLLGEKDFAGGGWERLAAWIRDLHALR